MPDAPANESNLGLGGWYDPRRLVAALPAQLRRWGAVFAACGLMLGLAVGLVAMRATYRLSATVRLVPPAQAMHVEASLDPYRVPEFHPEEVQSWFHRTGIFERLKAGLDRSESIDELRGMFSVTFDREASLFQVELAGAASASDAQVLLSYYCNVVIDESKQQTRARIRADEQYYADKLHQEVVELDQAKARLTDFAKSNGFAGIDSEAGVRAAQVAQARQAVAEAQVKLDGLLTRRATIPTLIADLPAEVSGGRSLHTPSENRLDDLRAEERRLGAIYTDGNPQLVAVRAQIAALKEPDAAPSRPDSLMRNPVLGMLEQELAQIGLSQPQVEQELAQARDRLHEAEVRLGLLPQLASDYQRLSLDVANSETLVRRLQARYAEIMIVGGLQGGLLQLSDAPKETYALERSKWLKVAACGVAGAFLGFAISCLFAAVQALREPLLRTTTDLRLVLGALQVERLPAPPGSVAEHRLWLQRMAETVTNAAKSALLVPSDRPRDSALLARALAEQVARSGLKTLLIADGGLLGMPPGKGLSHVLDREMHPEQGLVELDQKLSLLAIGDLPRLLDQASSGNLERLVGELTSHFDWVLVAPPVAEVALLRRLTQSLAEIIVIVGPAGMPRDIAEEIQRLQRPVTLAFLPELA